MVVVYPRGQLTNDDKARLEKVGITAIEADDPNSVNVLPTPLPAVQPVQYDDMLMAAFQGLAHSSHCQAKFVEDLHRRLALREKAAKESKA
jgi:hypothetical protein